MTFILLTTHEFGTDRLINLSHIKYVSDCQSYRRIHLNVTSGYIDVSDTLQQIMSKIETCPNSIII